MERNNLDRAIQIVRNIEHLERILKYVEDNKEYSKFGSIFEVKFNNDMSYGFPNNVEYSMFNNVLMSSIESDLEKYNNQLKEL